MMYSIYIIYNVLQPFCQFFISVLVEIGQFLLKESWKAIFDFFSKSSPLLFYLFYFILFYFIIIILLLLLFCLSNDFAGTETNEKTRSDKDYGLYQLEI